METYHSNGSGDQQHDKPWNPRPSSEKPKEGTAKEDAPPDRADDRPAEAESETNDALMETYNG
jgi:hypothetical protein